ncbi:MAG: GntR family transcriptional regulator [Fusobacteriaceae bacterium]
MKVIKMKSAREQVYDKLKEMIGEGKISQGQRIVELEYANYFKTSRTPVREALRMLELEGLLEESSNGGMAVKKITKKDILEIFEIRIALEGIILKEIIEKNNKNNIKKLEKIINLTKESIEREAKTNDVFKLFSQLNEAIYSISEYSRVVNLIKNINMYLKIFRRYSVDDLARRLFAYREHVAIVESLKNNDLKTALELNERHLKGSRDFLIKNFNKDIL